MENRFNISVEALKNMGIYELRELARQVGVKSPTTKRREELCEHIVQIYNGETAPSQNVVKKGRPPKSVSKVVNIFGEANAAENKIFNINNFPSINTPLKLNQSFYNGFMQAHNYVEGYLRGDNGKLHIFTFTNNLKKVYYVPNELVEEYKLRVGDKVEGSYVINDNNLYVFNQITKINNIDVASFLVCRKNLDINTAIFTQSKVEMFNKQLKKGARTIFYYINYTNAANHLIDGIDNSNKQTKYVFVGSELSPEHLFFIQSRPSVASFLSLYGQDLEVIENNVVNAINHVNTLTADGNNVVLVIFGVVNLLKSLDMYYSLKYQNEYKNHYAEAIQKIKKLVGMGRAVNEDVFVNTICIDLNSEKDNEFILSEISPLFNQTF